MCATVMIVNINGTYVDDCLSWRIEKISEVGGEIIGVELGRNQTKLDMRIEVNLIGD